MRAMILHGTVSLESGDAPLENVDLPVPLPAADGVLACGVWHTELDEIEGRAVPARDTMVPGHEVVRRLALAPGQRLLAVTEPREAEGRHTTSFDGRSRSTDHPSSCAVRFQAYLKLCIPTPDRRAQGRLDAAGVPTEIWTICPPKSTWGDRWNDIRALLFGSTPLKTKSGTG